MLIAIFIYLATIFGGSADLADRVEDAVADKNRERSALEVVQRIAALEETLASQVQVTSETLRSLHSRHDATRADYLEAFRPLEEARREALRRLLAARTDLQDILTEAEWNEVFPTP